MITAWPTGERDKVIARIAAHKAADEIAQGVGYANHCGTIRACAIGCSLDQYSHHEYTRVLGVDLRIAKLVDKIHESLPFSDAVSWPGRVAAALMPGADTTLAADRFVVWMLRHGVCGKNAQCATIASLYDERLQGREPSHETWVKARHAAYASYSDAAYAAYAAAAAANADAASAAAAYANAAYANAAYANAAYANAAARKAFWRDAAASLVEILSRCEAPK